LQDGFHRPTTEETQKARRDSSRTRPNESPENRSKESGSNAANARAYRTRNRRTLVANLKKLPSRETTREPAADSSR
jgi:hypothetical protein